MSQPRIARRRVTGVVGVLAVGTVIASLVGVYLKAFASTVDVTVISDRAGLLLERGAAVRAFGLPVGEVRSVNLTDDGDAAIQVALDPEKVDYIPADVTAAISATTVFGAKYVELIIPAGTTADPITSGAVVQTNSVVGEANDTFQNAIRVLQAVDVTAINNTLSQTAIALEGRGEQLGAYITQLDRYLAAFNRHLPSLATDIRRSRDVLDTYAAVTRDLVAAATQAGTTAVTLDENLATFDAFLTDIVGTSRDVGTFLEIIEEPLVQTITEITPVTDLLRVYSPGVGCLIDGLEDAVVRTAKTIGAMDAGVQGEAGFLPGQANYSPDKNLPKIVTGVGPVCYPTPDANSGIPPHIRFDDGTQDVYDGLGPVANPGTLHDPYGNGYTPGQASEAASSGDPLQTYLDLVRSYFGEPGVQRVLDNISKAQR